MLKEVYTKKCLLTMGVFDVLHKGHQKLLSRAKAIADKKNLSLVIMTFSPHPTRLFLGEEKCSKLVNTLDERLALLKNFKSKKIIIEKFDKKFSQKTPEEFIEYLKEILPNLEHICIGENFNFAKDASGDVAWLKKNSKKYGIEITPIKGVEYDERMISSTRIRGALLKGDVKKFYDLTNRFYDISGKVIGGNKIGRTIGFPTLNLSFNKEIIPKFGVYISKTTNLKTKKTYNSISNLGMKPSIKESSKKILLETNIIGSTKLTYSSDIKVELIDFIRAEKKFDTLEKLCEAISSDKEIAIKYWLNQKKG